MDAGDGHGSTGGALMYHCQPEIRVLSKPKGAFALLARDVSRVHGKPGLLTVTSQNPSTSAADPLGGATKLYKMLVAECKASVARNERRSVSVDRLTVIRHFGGKGSMATRRVKRLADSFTQPVAEFFGGLR